MMIRIWWSSFDDHHLIFIIIRWLLTSSSFRQHMIDDMWGRTFLKIYTFWSGRASLKGPRIALHLYQRLYGWCRLAPCGGNCPSKPESAINIGLLSLGDSPRGKSRKKRDGCPKMRGGSLICSLVSDNHCTLGSQPTLHNASSPATNDGKSKSVHENCRFFSLRKLLWWCYAIWTIHRLPEAL